MLYFVDYKQSSLIPFEYSSYAPNLFGLIYNIFNKQLLADSDTDLYYLHNFVIKIVLY